MPKLAARYLAPKTTETTKEKIMIKTYFFGVISPDCKGHSFYDPSGKYLTAYERYELPFRIEILDGGLLFNPQEQGRLHLATINGFTILGMWDRTGDSRPNSNSSFIAQGIHTMEQMVEISKSNFPNLWNRIHPPQPTKS